MFSSQPVDAKLKSSTSRTITNWKFICRNEYTVAWRNLRLLYQGHVNNWVYHHLSVRMGLHSFVHIYSICLENKIDLYVWNLVQRLQIFSQLWICQTQDIQNMCRERWLIEYLLILAVFWSSIHYQGRRKVWKSRGQSFICLSTICPPGWNRVGSVNPILTKGQIMPNTLLANVNLSLLLSLWWKKNPRKMVQDFLNLGHIL